MGRQQMAVGNPGDDLAGLSFFDSIGSSIPARFEQKAALYPQRVAIGSGSWQPTYAELDAASSSLAELIRDSRGSGNRVALLQKLDGFLIGSILGVLKAGQVVAVLNAADPLPRLQQHLLDIEPWLIVAEPATLALASQAAPPGVLVTVFPEPPPAHALGPLPAPVTPEGPADLAFLIQTSGSSGSSKLVMRTQRSVLAHVGHHDAEMRIQPDDRLLLLASPSSNNALVTIFGALLYGAAVCPFPVAEKGIIGLGEWIRRHDITIYVSAASAFRHFLKALQPDERFPRVRLVKLGAEAILGADLRTAAEHFREDCVYYCSYNCTEAGNMLQQRISAGHSISGFRVPLGNPASDTEVLLHDEKGRPVLDGEVGEIVIRSKFLSPGYWRDEKLTAERFTAAATDGTRGYRTGDLGRRGPDGALFYVGRRDDMVKIRGNRVILGEVEEKLKSLPAVQESAVLARTLTDGSPRLAAFVVAGTDQVCTAETIRQELATLLPSYMVPTEMIFLDHLPLNANGKIDRSGLIRLAESQAAPIAPDNLAPDGLATPTEALLSRIWEEVFGSAAGEHAHFFEAGGDSLNAGVVAAKVQAAIGVELDMLDFVEHPRLSDLALRIDELRRAKAEPRLPPVEHAPQRSHYELSFEQESIWRHSQQSADAHRGYTITRSYRLLGPLNAEALRKAMARVAADNEILRTTFRTIDGNPVQAVHPPEQVDLPVFDLSGKPDARNRGIALLEKEARKPLDLERGPLFILTLIRISPKEHWLVRHGHHILYDGWSWRLYLLELESAYESILKGLPPSLEANERQYGDYAVWQRSVFSRGSEFRGQLVDWWKNILANQPAAMDLPIRRRSTLWRVFRRDPKPSEGWLWLGLDLAIKIRITELARRESTTHFVIGLAAFSAVLAALTGGNRLTVGTYVTNRGNAALQYMQGSFARTLPLCLEYPRTGTFLDWLSTVRKRVVEVQTHAQLPREELWADLRSQGVNAPEIGVIFAGNHAPLPAKFSGLDLTAHSDQVMRLAVDQHHAAMPWGFTLSFDLDNAKHPFEITFDARIYQRSKVRSFLNSYVRVLDRLSAAPDQPMEELIRASL